MTSLFTLNGWFYLIQTEFFSKYKCNWYCTCVKNLKYGQLWLFNFKKIFHFDNFVYYFPFWLKMCFLVNSKKKNLEFFPITTYIKQTFMHQNKYSVKVTSMHRLSQSRKRQIQQIRQIDSHVVQRGESVFDLYTSVKSRP